MFIINIIKEVDTPITGWLTDIMFQVRPAQHLYTKGNLSESKLSKHMRDRKKWREQPGSIMNRR